MVTEAEQLHVPDHQSHDEGREVGRPAEKFGREVSERDDGEDGHPRRLVPYAGPRCRGDSVAENRPGNDADQGPQHEFFGELQRGTREGEPAGLHGADQCQGKYCARNVVEGRLGDYRLGHFGAKFQPVEQGDEDSRVCRGQYRSYEQGHREADAEHGGDHQRDDEGCQEYAGQDEQAEAYGGRGDNLQRDAGAAVEKDEGHPYVEQELGAHPAERIRDEPEHRRPDKGTRRNQHDHLGELYDRRYELRDQPRTQYEAEVAEDMLYVHPLADQDYELLRQRPPTQVLHAVPAHDLLAPPPLLLRQLQVIVERLCEVLLEAIHADAEVERQVAAHDLAGLPETRVVRHERDYAARGELRGHEPEGLGKDGGDRRSVRGGKHLRQVAMIERPDEQHVVLHAIGVDEHLLGELEVLKRTSRPTFQ